MYRKLTALFLALALMLGATGAQATGIVIGAPSSDPVATQAPAETETPDADAATESDAVEPSIEEEAPAATPDEPDANASPLIQVTAGGNASIFPSVDGMGSADYVDSMAACGDTLYVMGRSRLYAYKAGAQEMTVLVDYDADELLREARSAAYMTEEDLNRQEYAEDVADAARRYPSRLIGGGDALYAVNAVSGAYGPVVDGLIQPELTLQWDDMVIQESDWTMQRSVGSFVRTDRGLYAALGPNASSYSSLDYTLVRYDLTTGERTDLQVPGAQSVTAYRAGKLLVLGNDENYNVSVRVFDEESGAVESTLMAQSVTGEGGDTSLINYNSFGFAYDAAADFVYWLQDGQVRRTQDGKSAETVGYVTCDGGNMEYPGMLLAGGYYAVYTYSGAFVRTLDEAYRPERALHILGGWLDEPARAFANEHPEVPLVFESRWLDGSEAVRNDMLSASSNVDIYVINVRSGLRTLMEKGYLADLSGSETLLQNVQAMYPQFADALMYDGKLYGFPMSLTVNAWSYNAAALETLLPGAERPETFQDLIALLGEYDAAYPDGDEDYAIMNLWNGADELFSQMLTLYIAGHETQDGPLTLSGSSFIDTLKAMEEIQLPTYDWSSMTSEEQDELNEKLNRTPVMETYAYNLLTLPTSYDRRTGESVPVENIAPPVFAEGDTPVIIGDMQVYVVNPNSKNVDLAVRFLEYLAQHMDTQLDYQLHPDRTGAQRSPWYEQNLRSTQQYVDELEQTLESASEADRADIQASIDAQLAWMEEYARTDWYISEEGLQSYRALAPYVTLLPDSDLLSYESGTAMTQLQDILTRYRQGQIDADQMAREFDQKLQMIYMESL